MSEATSQEPTNTHVFYDPRMNSASERWIKSQRTEDPNEKTINEIAAKVFKGMKLGEGTRRKFLTKDDLRAWTKMMMEENDPDQEFDE